MDTVKLYLQNYDREKLFEKFNREYVVELFGSSNPQNTGRFNVPKKCLDLLKLNFGDYVYAIEDGTDYILLVKHVARKDRNKIVCKLRYGTGKKEKKERLRINQKLARYLDCEQLGFSFVSYNKSTAIKVSPVSLVLTIS
jgi:bifunctional DNA-binding transcriptional regulator/antitoxin component of YhaV-PrlF toxin-antitoxin module